MDANDPGCLKDAFLLHRRHYRETSLLLDVFSRTQGVLRLIAKGAMRPKAGRGSLLRPFLPLALEWSGRGELPALTVVESRGKAFALAGIALYCGFYLNELLLGLLPANDPQPAVFELYERSLEGLAVGERMEEILRFFELELMQALGYGLWLDRDVITGAEVREERFYLYRIEEGPVEAEPGGQAIRGSTLLGLRDGCLPGPTESAEAKRLMRRVISHYLDGKPLKSREMFRNCLTQESTS